MRDIRKRAHKVFSVGALTLVVAVQIASFALAMVSPVRAESSPEPNGPVKTFIVSYDSLPGEPTQAETVSQKRAKYRWLKNQFMTELSNTKGYKKVVRNLSEMPTSIVQVDAEGEASLRENKRITTIAENKLLDTEMHQAIPVLGGTVASGFSDGTTNFTGNGTLVGVMDDGFKTNHPMLSGKVVSEACFSMENESYSNVVITSGCPGGAASSTATGSSFSSDCTGTISTCDHGTAVASAAVGAAVTAGSDNYSGVAKNAKLVTIKVFTKWQEMAGHEDWCNNGSTVSTCWKLDSAGILSGMNHILQLQNDAVLDDPIVALNMSFGSGAYTNLTECDTSPGAATDNSLMQAMRGLNIAPVVAAGNSGNTDSGNGQPTYNSNANKVASPGCLDPAIGVASSSKDDDIAYYTQNGQLTDIFAPGGDLLNANDQGLMLANNNDTLTATQGTSFASPITAGGWAVMRQKNPTATVSTVLRIMQETGVNIVEDRPNYTAITKKRFVLDDALAALNDKPSITDAEVQGADFTQGESVEIAVTAPNATSCTTEDDTFPITNDEGVVTVTASSGSQSHTITCADDNDYTAQRIVGFVAGAADDGFPDGPNVGNDGDILNGTPGVPNTGFAGLLRNNPAATLAATVLTSATIAVIAKRYSAAR